MMLDATEAVMFGYVTLWSYTFLLDWDILNYIQVQVSFPQK